MHFSKYIAISALLSVATFAAPTPEETAVVVEAREPRGGFGGGLGGGLGGHKPAPAPAPKPAPEPAPKPAPAPVNKPKPSEKVSEGGKTKTTEAAEKPTASSETKTTNAAEKPTATSKTESSTATGKSSSVTASSSKVSSSSSSASSASSKTSSSTPAACSASDAPGKSGKVAARGVNTASGGKNQLTCGVDAAPDGQIDCTGAAAGTCATMCYAALCFGNKKNTGIQLEGNGGINSGKLTPGANSDDNRKDSGCRGMKFVRNGLTKAGLPVNGVTCDEWPPASSTQGGTGAVIQVVDDQNAQAHAVQNAHNGLILMRNFQGVPECVSLKSGNTAICGTSNKFSIFTANPPPKKGGTFAKAF